MLQKTVEKYPDSADAHSLFAQVSLRLFSGIKFILHSAQNVLQYFELKCTNQLQRWPMLGLLWGRSQVDSTVRPILRELKQQEKVLLLKLLLQMVKLLPSLITILNLWLLSLLSCTLLNRCHRAVVLEFGMFCSREILNTKKSRKTKCYKIITETVYTTRVKSDSPTL